MGTLTADKMDKNAGDPLKVVGATADPAQQLPAKTPPKYPQVTRRPPNAPPPSNAGGSGGQRPPAVASGSGEGGFFTIRKKGQGYWTRMGTVAGAGLIGALTIQFIFSERATFNLSDGMAELTCAVFAVGYMLLAFWLMNRPTHVDFLIATDSEMKKVNWTSRQELIGSTKVIILFMFILATFLFLMDLLFGYFFYGIGVLKEPPF
jgi:preprotein translocase SecE subunit